MMSPRSDIPWNAADLEPEIVSSRQALIDVIIGLSEHGEALTVLGGHAVTEVTRNVPSLPPPDTTRDGDLGVIPQLLTSDPRIPERMLELGYEQARPERPGVWSPIAQRERSIHARDSVDLIAPMSLSRDGMTSRRAIRSARVGDHGTSVSATAGTELSVVDRHRATLRAFDSDASVETYIAGPAALLCAKAHKIHDRMKPSELERNSQRLRPKDFADVYRLLHVITGDDARSVFQRGIEDPRVSEAVETGQRHLLTLLSDAEYCASMIADAWGDVTVEVHARRFIAQWAAQFRS